MTEVDLLNQSLNYLGEARVQSLTQSTNSAKYGADSMRLSVEQVLRQHPWNSALKRAKLNQLTDQNLFGPKLNYQLPTDYIKLVTFNDEVDDYKIEGKYIVTDETQVEILYVAYPEDFSLLDAGLVEAIATKLAFNIAINITGEVGTQARMLELHERFLARARTMDARESSRDAQSLYHDTLRDSEMIKSRHSTGIRYYPTTSNR